MKRAITLVTLFLSLSAVADQVVYPPLNNETLSGTWEALPRQHPPLLWHMKINEKGESYLVQVSVGGRGCTPQRLISSEVSNGKVKLHFASATVPELRDVTLPEIWIIGSGEGDKTRGVIEWENYDNQPRSGKPAVLFIKGPWTRDVAEASKAAEKAIKEQVSKR